MKAIQNYYYLYVNSDDNADGNVNCKNINLTSTILYLNSLESFQWISKVHRTICL